MASSSHGQPFGAAHDLTSVTRGVAVDESLLERARALGPVIREHADATERARRLAPPVMQAMREAGLFRMFTPLMLACAHAVRTSARITDLMHRMAGTSGIYERNPLERHFRDAMTVRHHGFLSEGRFETVGQVYLGLEPEFGFVAF